MNNRRSSSPASTPPATPSFPRRTIVFLDHTAMLGGGEIALFNLIRHLDRTRFEPVVLLFSPGPLEEKLRAINVETHVLPLAPSVVHTRKEQLNRSVLSRFKDLARILFYVFKLARAIRGRRAHLIHTNSLKADLIGGLAGKVARVPVLWHVRDRIADDYLPPKAARAFRALCRVLPHSIIANSHATLATLELPANWSKRKRNGTQRVGWVVHDGLEITGAPATAVAATPAITASTPRTIGIVGRISPWKGQHVFLEAAGLVYEKHPEVRFQIIGSALFGEESYERQLRDQATKLKLDGQLEWLGFRDDVPELIRQMDILVHASTVGEPFGQVVIEGMAAGKPVIATRGGGVPEIIEDGMSGVLVPMNDAPALASAMLDLLAAPERANALGAAGYHRVCGHFDIKDTARKVERVYEAMLLPL